jgi:ketosteroid isomerase-like protein
VSACASPPAKTLEASTAPDLAALRDQVRATETAFAKTMADRDHAAFSQFIADDAVFLNLGNPLRGKAAITNFWQRLFSERACAVFMEA